MANGTFFTLDDGTRLVGNIPYYTIVVARARLLSSRWQNAGLIRFMLHAKTLHYIRLGFYSLLLFFCLLL